MKDLRSFIRKEEKKREINREQQKTGDDVKNQHSTEATPEEIIKNYEGMSKNELMNELFSEVNKRKANGSFSAGEVRAFAERVAPMLDQGQRAELENIVNMLTK